MSTLPNNGGPAFPVNTSLHDGQLGHQTGRETWQFPGMTLRDFFAAAALQGISAAGHMSHNGDIARIAFERADAMLKARVA